MGRAAMHPAQDGFDPSLMSASRVVEVWGRGSGPLVTPALGGGEAQSATPPLIGSIDPTLVPAAPLVLASQCAHPLGTSHSQRWGRPQENSSRSWGRPLGMVVAW